MEQKEFSSDPPIMNKFNNEVIKYIEEFSIAVKGKGGMLLVTFPSYQETSFNKNIVAIQKVEDELLKSSLMVIGTPERYRIPDSLMFNSTYHLNKQGVDYRTKLLIQDIEKARSQNIMFKK
jgi:hypothetical protein